MNRLYYGDNLDVLREHVGDASVDLVYLDPPFNSNASYNILFKSPTGAGADASIEAFDDTWAWGPTAEGALLDVIGSGNTALVALLNAMERFIGKNAMMAYLAMMAVRLVELHRVLKPTGSLYLHCDPTASHYLKLVLDAVFGAENFRNEIIWKRTGSHGGSRRWGPIHDTIFYYSKGDQCIWNRVFQDYEAKYLSDFYRFSDDRGRYRLVTLTGAGIRKGDSGAPWREVNPTAGGRHWAVPAAALQAAYPERSLIGLTTQVKLDLLDQAGLIYWPTRGSVPQQKRYADEAAGVPIQDVLTDIGPVSSQAAERLGYPTQKPIALLERIIAASSNPGDVVLDPFCGCGTAVDAAQKLGRHWIGIDVTHLAVGLIEKRLREGYGDAVKFETIGVPRDLASAQRLAAEKPHDFQNWICLKLGGYPWMGGKKGGDKGVDGYFYYQGDDGSTRTGVISVKAGGNVNPGMVRDLGRVMARDGHDLGLFVSAALPTKGMEDEASSHGLFETHFGGDVSQSQRYPKLQIFTLAELFQDRRPKLPPLISPNRRAARVETRSSHKAGAQAGLDL